MRKPGWKKSGAGPDIDPEFVRRLAGLPHVLDVDRETLARVAGVSPEEYQSLEAGETEPCLNLLQNLCKGLRLSPAWLLLGEGEPTREASLRPGADFIAQRLQTVERTMKAAGATAEETKAAIMAALRMDSYSAGDSGGVYHLNEPGTPYQKK